MPCDCEGYSEPRAMEVDEAWRSLSRHHKAMELECESLRKVCKSMGKFLNSVKELYPGLHVPEFVLPKETPQWTGTTFRDRRSGKFPSDIKDHLDWLSKEDYK